MSSAIDGFPCMRAIKDPIRPYDRFFELIFNVFAFWGNSLAVIAAK